MPMTNHSKKFEESHNTFKGIIIKYVYNCSTLAHFWKES